MSDSSSEQYKVPGTPLSSHVHDPRTFRGRSVTIENSNLTDSPRRGRSKSKENVEEPADAAAQKIIDDWRRINVTSSAVDTSPAPPDEGGKNVPSEITTSATKGTNPAIPEKMSRKTIFTRIAIVVALVAIIWQRECAFELVGQYPEIWKPITLSKNSSWKDGDNLTRSSLKALSRQYPNQGDDFWIHLYAAISSTLTEDSPKQPSAVVFLIPADVRPTFAPCLAHKIGEEVHSIFEAIDGEKQYARSIMTITPRNFTDGTTITTIHERLLTYLKNGKTVIVQDVHKISQESDLMVFHAFCDNSAAPDTRATFFFLLPLPADYEVTDKYSIDEMTSQILHSSWTSLSPDKRPALIARVAVHNIMVKPGDTCDR